MATFRVQNEANEKYSMLLPILATNSEKLPSTHNVGNPAEDFR
jgi:hypothetical protein